ncbi:MarR family winged helix-turn-helix transcriptional regulator [Streptomyces corynorhini]|uniref:MarR family transcriptional regulator n=1 Tax=Streptomyces corynorhini TaxID=2282652 RepID=A0A370B571_9ACTN|nr:MarR family transcriptional regulator [Streptomyces corynorhini]RDG35013.1 MarR family transcriptional regulator [Streptomyces corynorhini]
MDDGLADLLHRVVFLLGEAARQRDDGPAGLSYSQMRLLGTLEDIQPVTQHQLAQALSVSDPAISRALRPLEAAGLVRVRPDPEHGRRRLVGITDAGSTAFHGSAKPLYDALRNALLEADFPYERYLRDTALLAQLLESAAQGSRPGAP